MSISNEKRTIIIEAKLRGETEKNIAKWLNISPSSVSTIWKLYQTTGDVRLCWNQRSKQSSNHNNETRTNV